MPVRQCYYCQGSINYSFCDKMRALDAQLSEEVCSTIVSEITIMEQEIQELKKSLDDLQKQHPPVA